MPGTYFDCVWYRKALSAAGKALQLSNELAEPMFVVHDIAAGMYGIGEGGQEPDWCRDSNEINFICVIQPQIH